MCGTDRNSGCVALILPEPRSWLSGKPCKPTLAYPSNSKRPRACPRRPEKRNDCALTPRLFHRTIGSQTHFQVVAEGYPMGIESISELIRFVQFAPLRINRLWDILRSPAAAAKPDSLGNIFDLLHGTDTEGGHKSLQARCGERLLHSQPRISSQPFEPSRRYSRFTAHSARVIQFRR